MVPFRVAAVNLRRQVFSAIALVVPCVLGIVAAAAALNGCLFSNECYTDCAPPPDYIPPQSTCSSVKRQCTPDTKGILTCNEEGGWQVAEMCSAGTLCRTTNVGVTCLPVSADPDASMAGDGAAGDQ